MIKYVVIHNYLQLRVIHNGLFNIVNGHSDSMWFMHMGYGTMGSVNPQDNATRNN